MSYRCPNCSRTDFYTSHGFNKHKAKCLRHGRGASKGRRPLVPVSASSFARENFKGSQAEYLVFDAVPDDEWYEVATYYAKSPADAVRMAESEHGKAMYRYVAKSMDGLQRRAAARRRKSSSNKPPADRVTGHPRSCKCEGCKKAARAFERFYGMS